LIGPVSAPISVWGNTTPICIRTVYPRRGTIMLAERAGGVVAIGAAARLGR
jgi:hypothetical protein